MGSVAARALEAWMSYNECKSEIETVFDKFDSDKSGGLDREQLRNLLTELNGGEAPNSQVHSPSPGARPGGSCCANAACRANRKWTSF